MNKREKRDEKSKEFFEINVSKRHSMTNKTLMALLSKYQQKKIIKLNNNKFINSITRRQNHKENLKN